MRLSQCPDCNSSNIKFFEARNRYSCNDCGFSFSDEMQVAKKLRIFLSYGHDHNEELVRLIKTDLEKRGHDVWFDKNEIKFGDEWRRSITDGIIGSNRVLSFLSKYSTRDPGVCRDEIAIAIGVKGGNIQTILVESEQEVQPPVNIGHIQWLDMHEWNEKRTIGDAIWETWYQSKLAEIIRVVESDESRRFAGEIDKLNEYLKPIKSDARISSLLSKGFYGREWLFDTVEKWREDTTHDSRLFWIMGDPGVGKSAFAAQLTHKRGDIVIAAQFCDWTMPDHRDARRVVCSVAFQMATRLPDYRKLLLTLPEIKELDRKDALELFDYLLANPLKSVINGGREKLLIVIDALDEAGESGRNILVDMLSHNAHHLPDWLGIIVTSRPEFDVKTPFQALNPFQLDTKSESNKADIQDYLNNKLVTKLKNKLNAVALINQILDKSEGVFLYAERFCEDVFQGHIYLDQPNQFPQGLGGIFAQYFQRQFPDLEKFRREIRPALRAILAAREPLPLEILQKLFNWEDEELRDFTHTLGSLFPVTKTTDSETIKPYHKSLADWMEDEAKAGGYFVSVREGHKILSEEFQREWASQSLIIEKYWAKNANSHLHRAGNKEVAYSLFQDRQFMVLYNKYKPNSFKNFDLFISYSLTDNINGTIEQFLKCIQSDYDNYTGEHLTYFFNKEEIRTMEDYHHKLSSGLRNSHLCLLILSPNYLSKPFWQWDIIEFLKHENQSDCFAIIYIKTIPDLLELAFQNQNKSSLGEIIRRQHFDVRHFYENGLISYNIIEERKRIELIMALNRRINRIQGISEVPGNLPAPNPRFVGRKREMEMLHKAIALGQLGVITAVHGVGGLGKTAIAFQYAYAYANFYPGGRWYLGCSNETNLASVIKKLDADLNVTFTEDEKKDDIRGAKRILNELYNRAVENAEKANSKSNSTASDKEIIKPAVLLILDNVDHPELIQAPCSDIISGKEWLKILVTTRLGPEELGEDETTQKLLTIDELPFDDGVSLIESFQQGGRFKNSEEKEKAGEIVKLLGGFTLAVEVAALFLFEKKGTINCAELLEVLKRKGIDYVGENTKKQLLHTKLISKTLAPTIERLSPSEKLLIKYASQQPHDDINLSSIRKLIIKKYPELEIDAEVGLDDPWRTIINHLLSLRLFHIVQLDSDVFSTTIVRMNCLVKDFIRLQKF